MWRANGSDAGGDIVSVKRKKSRGDEEPQSEVLVYSSDKRMNKKKIRLFSRTMSVSEFLTNFGVQEEAVSTLVGHTQCVSSVVWPQHETIYSASWDHSIRRWDVETGKDSLKMVRELPSSTLSFPVWRKEKKENKIYLYMA